MKKKNWVILILVLILCVGTFLFKKHLEQKKEEDIYFTKQEKRVTLYFKYNVDGFKSIQFTKRKVTPMGTPYVNGNINNDKKLNFSASMPNAENFNGQQMGYSTEFSKLLSNDEITMDEIENLEKEKVLKNK